MTLTQTHPILSSKVGYMTVRQTLNPKFGQYFSPPMVEINLTLLVSNPNSTIFFNDYQAIKFI